MYINFLIAPMIINTKLNNITVNKNTLSLKYVKRAPTVTLN